MPPTHLDVPRLRLLAQGIARPSATTADAVVTHLGAIQAQDYHGALWSIGLRIAGATRAGVERAIACRTIVRTWPMRGTLHFVPSTDARWMLELMAPRIMKAAAARHRQLELDDAAFRRSRMLVARALKDEPVLSRGAIFDALEKGGVSTAGQRGIHICSGSTWTGCSATGRMPRSSPPSHCSTTGFTPRASSIARTPSGRSPSATSSATDRPRCATSWGGPGAALAPRYAGRIVPGANGMFLSTLVLDGRVCGTWKRTERAKSVTVEASPFTRSKATAKREFDGPAERYGRFLGMGVTVDWIE